MYEQNQAYSAKLLEKWFVALLCDILDSLTMFAWKRSQEVEEETLYFHLVLLNIFWLQK